MKKSTALFKRKSFWIVFSAAVVVTVISLTAFLNTPKQVYLRNKAEFNTAAEYVLKNQDKDDIKVGKVIDISYHDGKSPIVEFTTFSWGLVPSSTYKGIYIPLMELLYHFKIPTFPYRKRKMAGHGQTLKVAIGEQQNILRVTGTLLKLTFKRIIKTQKAENLVIFCFLLLCQLNFIEYVP